MNKNRLSIYLVKADKINESDIIKDYENVHVIENVGKVFYKRSYSKSPMWLDDFYKGTLDKRDFTTSSASAVLMVKSNVEKEERIFLITFGRGRFLINFDAVVEDFGIKLALNCTSAESLRKIKKKSIGGNQKISDEQLPFKSNIDEFEVDVNRDLISSITSVSLSENISTGNIVGSNSVTITADVDIMTIKLYLVELYKKYNSSEYKKDFSWIDNIIAVKDKTLIDNLDSAVVNKILDGSSEVIAAVPEVINWDLINCFEYNNKTHKEDITIDEIKMSMRKPLSHISQLKQKYINAISNVDGSTVYRWSVYECLFAEIMFNGHNYCLNNRNWYCIDDNYTKLINDDYNSTKISDINFTKLKKSKSLSGITYEEEKNYNEYFASVNPKYLNMDRKDVIYGGSGSRFEICDLLSNDKKLIHVKKYSGSSVLSHLFNQGLVSADLIRSDPDFLIFANSKINELLDSRTDISDRKVYILNSDDNLVIVYAIIKSGNEKLPSIPFFSKIALYHVKRRLRACNCQVEIAHIEKE